MSQSRSTKLTQRAIAIVAILFGLLTIFAGTRVLLGSNPGYNVFQPLLIYNTSMGIAYVIAGIITWRNLIQGKRVAAIIFSLNILVLGIIGYLYISTSLVAAESLAAMTFRSLLWLVLFLGLTWVSRKER